MASRGSPAPRAGQNRWLGTDAFICTVLSFAASLACSDSGAILWDNEHTTIRTNVLGTDAGSLKFWPRELQPYLPAWLPCFNLAMLGYCVFIASKVHVAMPDAPAVQSGVATLLTAFGGGTIVPLLLGVPVVWLRGGDLFLFHVVVAWAIVNLELLAPLKIQLLNRHPRRLLVNLLFEMFRGAVIFALIAMARGAGVPGGVGVLSLLVCGTLGGCGGIFMPFSKGLDALSEGAPPLMTSAFCATASFLTLRAFVESSFGQEALHNTTPSLAQCTDPRELDQLGQFLTVVFFVTKFVIPSVPKLL
eukprot:COSAG05_NODE_31_length_28416_cov_170.150652_4_plen_304_part_00